MARAQIQRTFRKIVLFSEEPKLAQVARFATEEQKKEEEKRDRWLRWIVFAGCGTFLYQFIAYNFVDIDIWHQMALVRESLSAGHLLKTDPYSYTPTLPWIDHEWGAGAIAYFTTTCLGSRAILVLKFILSLGAGFVCIRCSEARGGGFRVLSLCAPLAILLTYLGFVAAVRAQAYSFFLTALWLWFLELDRRGARRWIIYSVLVFPLWVNLHAGFVVALALVAAHAVENRLRRKPVRHLIVLLCGMSLEIFINPYGAHYFSYLNRALTMARPYAPEWDTVYSLGWPWFYGFIAAVVLAVYSVWSLGWTRANGILIVTSTAVEAALHRKLVPLFAIAWLCYVPSLLQSTALGNWWIAFTRRRSGFTSTAWIAITCVCLVAAIRQKPWVLAVPQPIYPVGPVQYLAKERFAGNLMVPFRIGAYVSWKLYPAVKISLDSRYEVAYPEAVVRRGFDFYAASSDWRSILQAFPTDAVLVPIDMPIATLMPETGWRMVYTDQQFQIYARPGLDLQTEDWRSNTFAGVFP